MISQDDVIYFVLTDRFCNGDPGNDQPAQPANPRHFHGGDFAGLVQKIPYFKALGVTAVWLTPVYVNIVDLGDSAGYHGYWAVDFERVDPHLYRNRPELAAGSRAYLAELVRTFHAYDLKVILDMVVNHTGYHTQGYRDYPFQRFGPGHFNDPNARDEVKGSLAGLPDLNHDLPEVADYFVQNILDWIEQTGIDAIRMDTVKHVEKPFWYLFKSLIRTRHPQVTLLGEALLYDPNEVGRYQREHDFDTLFDFPLCGAVKDALVWDRPMTTLARPRLYDGEPKGILDRDGVYTNANRLVTLLDNHDLDRRITTEILDKVGHWDRDLARQILKLCLTFLFTTRGIPQVYYGTEIGLEGWADPDNRRDMPWEVFGPDQRPTPDRVFERDLYDHTARMIRLRSQNPAIRYGYLFTLYVDQYFYAYLREFQGNLVLVAINNGRDPMPAPATVEIGANSNIPPRITHRLMGSQRLASQIPGIGDVTATGGRAQVQLAGKTAGVWTL
jgi:alpha-amylase